MNLKDLRLKDFRYCRASVAAGVALFVALAAGMVSAAPHGGLIGPLPAEAQNLGQRVVTGKVLDDSSAPVGGAVVFLKNLKSKSIRSYTSAADGKFRFTQVNMSDEFDIWAEKAGKKSANKNISSWDTRKEIDCELKLK